MKHIHIHLVAPRTRAKPTQDRIASMIAKAERKVADAAPGSPIHKQLTARIALLRRYQAKDVLTVRQAKAKLDEAKRRVSEIESGTGKGGNLLFEWKTKVQYYTNQLKEAEEREKSRRNDSVDAERKYWATFGGRKVEGDWETVRNAAVSYLKKEILPRGQHQVIWVEGTRPDGSRTEPQAIRSIHLSRDATSAPLMDEYRPDVMTLGQLKKELAKPGLSPERKAALEAELKKREGTKDASELKPSEPDLIFHQGRQYVKTNETIRFNNREARKYKEKGGLRYVTREVNSGIVHDAKDSPTTEEIRRALLHAKKWGYSGREPGQGAMQLRIDLMRTGYRANPEALKRLEEVLRTMGTGDALAGERTFSTYAAWRRAVTEINPMARIEGNKEIANAPGIGEWDGERGVIYAHNRMQKKPGARDAEFTYVVKLRKPTGGFHLETVTVPGGGADHNRALQVAEQRTGLIGVSATRREALEYNRQLSHRQNRDARFYPDWESELHRKYGDEVVIKGDDLRAEAWVKGRKVGNWVGRSGDVGSNGRNGTGTVDGFASFQSANNAKDAGGFDPKHFPRKGHQTNMTVTKERWDRIQVGQSFQVQSGVEGRVIAKQKNGNTYQLVLEQTQDAGGFEESKHPRASNGQFGSGGGSSKGGGSPAAKEKERVAGLKSDYASQKKIMSSAPGWTKAEGVKGAEGGTRFTNGQGTLTMWGGGLWTYVPKGETRASKKGENAASLAKFVGVKE